MQHIIQSPKWNLGTILNNSRCENAEINGWFLCGLGCIEVWTYEHWLCNVVAKVTTLNINNEPTAPIASGKGLDG